MQHRLCATLGTVAHQAPLSMGFSRQEYWSGLSCPPPANLPYLGIEPTSLMSPALAVRFLTTSTPWEAHVQYIAYYFSDNSLRINNTYTQNLITREAFPGLAWWVRSLRICLKCRRPGFDPWVGKIPSRREWLCTPVFSAGEFHGQRSQGVAKNQT